MPDPALTVVIPVFNGASVMDGAIASVVSQQFTAWELLVVDDGSADDSATRAAGWAARDPRVRLLRHPTNQGIARTLNRGIREARAPLVLILHQDCALVGPDWMTRAIGAFNGPACVAVVASALHSIAEMTRVEKLFWIIRNHVGRTDAGTPFRDDDRLFSENKCDLFRKALLLSVGGFDESLAGGGEDQVLALRLEERGLHVRRPPDLLFRATLGTDRTVAENLRKERAYGHQIQTVLFRTGFRAVRRTHTGRVDPQLMNRMSILGWVAWVVGFVVAGVLVDRPWVAALALVGPALRMAQLWSRAARARRSYELTGTDVLLAGPLGIVSDFAYLTGLVLPTRRRPRGSAA